MEKELVQLFKKVEKAADAVGFDVGGGSTAEEERCLDVLQKLKGFPVNYDIIASTQLGKRLRQLSKHPRNKIQSLAFDVLTIWRGVVLKARAEMYRKRMAAGWLHAQKDQKQKLKLVPLTGDKHRDKIREMIAGALSKVGDEVKDMNLKREINKCDPYLVAAEVESAIFCRWGLFNGAQKLKYRSIMFNLRDTRNPDFRRKVLLGVYPPESFTQLTHQQMASDVRKQEMEDIKKRALLECERGGLKAAASTDGFKCSRCNKRETTYSQLQTRSADEPMTTYVTCVTCGNRWKE